MPRCLMPIVTGMLLCILSLTAAGAALAVPDEEEVRTAFVFGDFVKYEVTDPQDVERIFAELREIDDLTAPNEQYAFAAGGIPRGVLFELKDGKTVCYEVWGDNRIQREGSASPAILSGKLGTLRGLIEELSQKYQPDVEPFLLASPGEIPAPGQADGGTLHLYDNPTKSYAPVKGGRLTRLIGALAALDGAGRPAGPDELGAALASPDGMAVYDGEIKLEYEFYEKGILIKTHVNRYNFGQEPFRSDMGIPDRAYVFSGEGYRALRNLLREDMKELPKGDYWLGMMRYYKLRGRAGMPPAFSLHNYLTGYRRESDANEGIIFSDLKALQIEPESYQKITGQVLLSEPELAIEIRFEGGIVYTVSMNQSYLQVHSSDVRYAVRHRFAAGSPGYGRLLEIASEAQRYADVRQNPGT
ncbi:hypothetical protein [Harryflintia acetispora]|uniref:hypothetical protein n=1 Tax=Harryflintia acetispora TaxID=1849041 RepID=UPI00189B80B9|nr:hypothetical protein [Harryflintia acetispora]